MKMKRIKIVLTATLLSSVTLMAMTAKVNDANKVVYEVIEGSSSSVKGKPSLNAEVKYKSQHVDVGVSADVNITINTALTKGILNVNLRPLKENRLDVAEKDLKFTLRKGKNSFPINFQVSSQENGIHYINLTLSVKGEGVKVVAIPVNVGSVSKKIDNKSIEKTENGVVSVSSAEEEIK